MSVLVCSEECSVIASSLMALRLFAGHLCNFIITTSEIFGFTVTNSFYSKNHCLDWSWINCALIKLSIAIFYNFVRLLILEMLLPKLFLSKLSIRPNFILILILILKWTILITNILVYFVFVTYKITQYNPLICSRTDK